MGTVVDKITPQHKSVGCSRVYEVGADEMAVRKGWKKRLRVNK